MSSAQNDANAKTESSHQLQVDCGKTHRSIPAFELKALQGGTRQSAPVVCLMRCVVTRSLIRVCLDELLDEDNWRKGWFRGRGAGEVIRISES